MWKCIPWQKAPLIGLSNELDSSTKSMLTIMQVILRMRATTRSSWVRITTTKMESRSRCMRKSFSMRSRKTFCTLPNGSRLLCWFLLPSSFSDRQSSGLLRPVERRERSSYYSVLLRTWDLRRSFLRRVEESVNCVRPRPDRRLLEVGIETWNDVLAGSSGRCHAICRMLSSLVVRY